jgi:tetratricopeptide (TPR) repeat protein
MNLNRSIFILNFSIIAALMLLIPSVVQSEKATLFEATPPPQHKMPEPEPQPEPLPEKKIKKPVVKKKPSINLKQDKLFVKNLQEGIKAFKAKNYEASIPLLEESLKSIKFLPHRKSSAKNIYKLLVQASVKLEDFNQAVEFQSRVVNLIHKEGEDNDQNELALENSNLGNYYFLIKDNESAADFFIQALDHYKDLEYDDKSAAIYNDLGKIYESDSKYD